MATVQIDKPMAAITSATVVMTQDEFNDKFDDIIHGGVPSEDDRGRGEESCFFHIGECDKSAKFWLSVADENEESGQSKYYFCPRHFALRLHLIIEAIHRNVYFDEQSNPSQIRGVLQSYILSWGRIGL